MVVVLTEVGEIVRPEGKVTKDLVGNNGLFDQDEEVEEEGGGQQQQLEEVVELARHGGGW